ncbi:MAG: BrnT family toxin [Thermoleophilaceae bacterium]
MACGLRVGRRQPTACVGAGVDAADAEDGLLDPARIGVPAYRARGEQRWAALGATEDGRVLFVVFTRRRSKVRVITARDAAPREKRRYRRSWR